MQFAGALPSFYDLRCSQRFDNPLSLYPRSFSFNLFHPHTYIINHATPYHLQIPMSAPFPDHLSAWSASRITSLFTSPTITAFWDSLDSSVSPKAIVTLNGVGLTREQYGDQLSQILKLEGDQRERRVEIDSLDVLSTPTLFSERDQSHTVSLSHIS